MEANIILSFLRHSAERVRPSPVAIPYGHKAKKKVWICCREGTLHSLNQWRRTLFAGCGMIKSLSTTAQCVARLAHKQRWMAIAWRAALAL